MARPAAPRPPHYGGRAAASWSQLYRRGLGRLVRPERAGCSSAHYPRIRRRRSGRHLLHDAHRLRGPTPAEGIGLGELTLWRESPHPPGARWSTSSALELAPRPGHWPTGSPTCATSTAAYAVTSVGPTDRPAGAPATVRVLPRPTPAPASSAASDSAARPLRRHSSRPATCTGATLPARRGSTPRAFRSGSRPTRTCAPRASPKPRSILRHPARHRYLHGRSRCASTRAPQAHRSSSRCASTHRRTA